MIRLVAFRNVVSVLFGTVYLLASSTIAVTRVAANDDAHRIQEDLIAWVRSKGGSFSDKLEIRRVDPTNPSSYLGVFVKPDQPIAAKESLFVIPKSCYLDVMNTALPMDPADEGVEAAYHANLCQLATKLMHEMELGSASEYAPYVAYLKTQKPGQLPVHWSPAGKDLLRRVAIPGSPIVDWIDWNFKSETNNCVQKMEVGDSGKTNDGISVAEHMVEMTIQRCFDTALIPIWDMVNHDNGRINTENDSMHDPNGLKVRAARDLAGGEEIFASYDACLDCQGIDEFWGTPEILKDFGFVENYPHRWVFPEIWFEIGQGYDFDAYFGPELDAPTPSPDHLEFLRTELARLEEVGVQYLGRDLKQGSGEAKERPETVSEREWETILRFHEVSVMDLFAVVDFYSHSEDDDDDSTDPVAHQGEL